VWRFIVGAVFAVLATLYKGGGKLRPLVVTGAKRSAKLNAEINKALGTGEKNVARSAGIQPE
jgi:hypothetical protein